MRVSNASLPLAVMLLNTSDHCGDRLLIPKFLFGS